MRRPKYSIALPTLCGEQTLSVTLPEMAKIDRDDVEWVISDNLSEDNTAEVVCGLNDPRFRLVRPSKRLTAGENLDFAYSHARGEWMGHLGDDDLLFPSRFEVLDRVMEATAADVIRGGFVRYHWPDYYDRSLANTLDPGLFSGKIEVYAGREIAEASLNQKSVYGGGSWCVRAELVEAVRRRAGFFASSNHLEFFCMRAAQLLADKVAYVELPTWVLGRHSGSSGAQAFAKKGSNCEQTWDWEFEVPHWNHCPFPFKGYSTVSLDGSLLVKDKFPDQLAGARVRWVYWITEIRNEIDRQLEKKRTSPKSKRQFLLALRRLPFPHSLSGFLLHFRSARRLVSATTWLSARLGSKPAREATRGFGWPGRLDGGKVGIHGIEHVPGWVERAFPGYFDLACPRGGSTLEIAEMTLTARPDSSTVSPSRSRTSGGGV